MINIGSLTCRVNYMLNNNVGWWLWVGLYCPLEDRTGADRL